MSRKLVHIYRTADYLKDSFAPVIMRLLESFGNTQPRRGSLMPIAANVLAANEISKAEHR